jgi:hypothetical protein
MARIDALTTGGNTALVDYRAVLPKVTESAFTWHRMIRGIRNRKSGCHKLEQETQVAAAGTGGAPQKPTSPQS